LFSLWIRAKRWEYLLNPLKKVRIWELFNATAIGFMANNIFPARVGEVVRAVVLGHRAKINKTASFATIVVERLFDGFTILFLLLIVIYFMSFPPESSSILTRGTVKSAGLLSFVFYVLVLSVLLLLRFHNRKANQVISIFLKKLPEKISTKITRQIDSFVSGLDVLKEFKDILIIFCYSFFLWLTLSFSTYLLFVGFHLQLSLWAAVFLEVVLVFGVAIPSAPGYVGTFHWICAAGLIFLGVEANQAKSFAVVLWLTGFIPVTGLGLALLWKEGFTLHLLKKPEE
ncbi:MAG: flippase-like domain-containing protein, partial [Deltaproteobacteria bacterium]|nr:flippase-like domain-containing protein [Deltaproteobacteria bacterium]